MPEKDQATTMTDLMKPGFTAVITGASSGIGRAAALQYSSAGMHVFMADNDEEELMLAKEMVQSKCTAENQMVQAHVVDVSDAQRVGP
jgi:NADP-dependent 3-hydroxy acid dehydrogenase YdfG